MKHAPVALQLYTVRDAVARDITDTLSQVARMKYEGVEFAGFGGLAPSRVREVLDGEGLTAVACHVGVPALEADFDRAVSEVQEVGASFVVCPWVDPAVAHDAARWVDFAGRLQGWALACRARGLTFAYHNHVFEFEARHDGEFALDRLWRVAPDVRIELDAAWAFAGGVDPAAYLRGLAARVPLLHVKDVTVHGAERETVELGEGEVPLPAVLDAARDAGVEWLIVEQDQCRRDPLESARANAAWLRGALSVTT
ncbi:sugar phosphate isomerase/epimerase family protein [Deinococcus pimensis]|uniref:sugar phosphate isomerase/epimerase family protein n=1 Tax=Deinococcus pimensis TaxID=309888 RepID=UPI0004897A39|nr:sugar phosphate isomerase/epimerase [Deinococcus pimensis]